MNPEILLELAKKWEREVKDSEEATASRDAPSGPSGAAIQDSEERKECGRRESKRECADTLRTLVQMLG